MENVSEIYFVIGQLSTSRISMNFVIKCLGVRYLNLFNTCNTFGLLEKIKTVGMYGRNMSKDTWKESVWSRAWELESIH